MSDTTLLVDPERARQLVLALGMGTIVGSGLLAVSLLVLGVWRRPSAGMRHQVVLLALLSLLALPFVAAAVVDFAAPGLQGLRGHFDASGKFEDLRSWAPTGVAAPSASVGWERVLILWASGALLVLLGLSRRLVWLCRFHRQCRPVTDPAWGAALDDVRSSLGIRRSVRLLAHPRVASPMVWGPPRAFVLIPEAMARLTPAEAGARLTFLHELAHLERHDSLWKLSADVVCALNWFNPLAWISRSRLEEAQEMAADSRVLGVGVRPSTYSSHLLELYRRGMAGRLAAPGMSAMAGVGALTGRLSAILERDRNHRAPSFRLSSVICAGFLAFFAAFVAVAQNSSGGASTDHDSLHAVLNPVFVNKMADDRVAGAAVAVVKDGELVYQHGFGQAEVFEPRPVDVDQTIFRIGSVTKVVTGIAVMQCVDRGLLDLEADVNRYLKEFQVDDHYPEPVRVKHLLTHTAGFDQLGTGRHVRSRDQVLPLGTFLKDNLVRIRAPEEVTCYDTYAITLAGYLVEVVSGLSYEEYLKQNLFAPLGMERSFITVPDELRGDLAVGYEYRGEWFPQRWEYMNTDPASTVNSTVGDMAKLAMMLLDGGTYGGERILSTRSAGAMMTRQFTNHPDQPGYGYVLMEDSEYGVPAFSHGGSMTGYGCFLYLIPEERIGLFVAYNQESGGLGQRVIEAAVDRMLPHRDFGREARARVQGVDLDPFVGEYANNMYNHSRPNSGGWSRRPFTLNPSSDGALIFRDRSYYPVGDLAFQSDDRLLITFVADESGRVTHMLAQQAVYEKLD